MKHSHDFQPNRDERGIPGVTGTCRDCGAAETVRAPLARSRGPGHGSGLANESISVALNKLTAKGWTYVGKTLRCPACDKARRVTKVWGSQPATPATTPPTIEEETAMETKTKKTFNKLTHEHAFYVIRELNNAVEKGILIAHDDNTCEYREGYSDAALAAEINAIIRREDTLPELTDDLIRKGLADLRRKKFGNFRHKVVPPSPLKAAVGSLDERVALLEDVINDIEMIAKKNRQILWWVCRLNGLSERDLGVVVTDPDGDITADIFKGYVESKSA